MRRAWAVAGAGALALLGCASRGPRVAVGPLDAGVDAFLAAHPRPADQEIRVDEVARTATASYHVVQMAGRESPHRHVAHDLTVIVLRGRGTLVRGADVVPMTAGTIALVPRGTLHWFAREGRGAAVALVVFTPPLDEPDTVPATGVDSEELDG